MQPHPDMQGTITGRDVLRHSLTILRLWGPSCYLRCLRAMVAHRSCTFLEVLYGARGPSDARAARSRRATPSG